MINLLLVFLFLFSPLFFIFYFLWEVLAVVWASAAAIATLFTAIAAFFTALAVFRGNRATRNIADATRKAAEATRQTAEQTRKAAEGQLFMQIRTENSSEEMLRGMRRLIQFEQDHGENYAAKFGEKLRKSYSDVAKEDAGRRRFAHWRLAVQALRDHKFISQNLFDELWKESDQEFYEIYIQPLEPEIKRDMEERKRRRALRKKTDEKAG